MNFGKLDRKVTLQAMAATQDAYGEKKPAYSTLASVWAQRVDQQGREILKNGLAEAQLGTRFFIRYRTDIDEKMRVIDRGDVFDIVQVREIGRQEGLELTCVRAEG